MKILGVEGLSDEALMHELNNGARLVMYTYTISIIVMTFKRSSDVYFVKAGESRRLKGLPYMLLTLLFGWWGFPWGPIYSVWSLFENLAGGKDVTSEILAAV